MEYHKVVFFTVRQQLVSKSCMFNDKLKSSVQKNRFLVKIIVIANKTVDVVLNHR